LLRECLKHQVNTVLWDGFRMGCPWLSKCWLNRLRIASGSWFIKPGRCVYPNF
jgi:hypothetical protein